MADASEKPVFMDDAKRDISDARASINVLFTEPGKDGDVIIDIYRRDFIEHYLKTLQAVQHDLNTLKKDAASAARRHTVIDDKIRFGGLRQLPGQTLRRQIAGGKS